MEALSKVAEAELAQVRREPLSLLKQSSDRLTADMATSLGAMMAQMKARFPNQTFADSLTTDMWFQEWEEMVLKYGLEAFRDGLSKAIREEGRQFMPDPNELRIHVKYIARITADRRQREDWESVVAQVRREREEDADNPQPKSELELKLGAQLDRILAAKDKPGTEVSE